MPQADATPVGEGAEQAAGTAAPNLIDSATDLIGTVVSYARQETGDLVHDKVVIPGQKVGVTIGLAITIGILVATGALFIATGVLLVLANWLGWPGALFAVGGVLVVASIITVVIRSRSVQR